MSSMIQSISSAAQSAAAAGVKETPKVQRQKNEAPDHFSKPVMDEYVPEEKREPSGRYWLGKDGDGRPKIYFDDPERAADSKKAELCRGSTDKVDREIERLKRKQDELERQVDIETDPIKVKTLAQTLAQVERELAQKDNEMYRRQHTVFS